MEIAREHAMDEADIQRLLEKRANAIRAMDLGNLMPVYAPDLVSFDIVPPLQYKGADEKKKPWIDLFSMYRPPLNYEIHSLVINVSNDMAYSRCFNRISGILKNGERTSGYWARWTACFRKIGGSWLITHEQVSVPVDFRSGRALLDLEP